MKNSSLISAGVAAVLIVATASTLPARAAAVSGQGTWQTTLQARDLDGNLANGPEAYYDTDLGITWLANANLAASPMTWDQAMTWAMTLNINGVTGWRLPTSHTTTSGDLTYAGSEFSHLDFVTLGNPVAAPTNTGGFANVQSTYWSSLSYEREATLSDAWIFHWGGGPSDAKKASPIFYAWAVHSGGIGTAMASTSPVPEPQAWILALVGLGMFGFIAYRKVA